MLRCFGASTDMETKGKLELKFEARKKHTKDLEHSRELKNFMPEFRERGHSDPDFDKCSCRTGL